MEFKEKLQQLRKQKELTQEELAEALFVSRTAVSKWESGRGYPSIDSLKAISKLFLVSIDLLLSGEELISLAEAESKEKTRGLRDLVFGALDCMTALLFFLPLFGQKSGDVILSVSLFTLTDLMIYMRVAYILILSLTAVWGIVQLALQNVHHRLWQQNKLYVSLFLSAFGTLVFIASREPYAATFIFFMLLIKGILLVKQQ